MAGVVVLGGAGLVGAKAMVGGGDSLPPPAAAALQPRAVAVERRDFASTLTLRGTVQRGEATPIKASAPGSEVQWKVADGATVAAGAVLLTEAGADEGAALADLKEQAAAASDELRFLQQSSAFDLADADAALDRANLAVAEAVDALAAAQAALRAEESRQPDEDEDPSERQARIDAAKAAVRAAERAKQAAEADAADALRNRDRTRLGNEQQLAKARVAASTLQARVQRASGRARDVTAERAGIVRIAARVAGDDRIVGRLEPAGFVIDTNVDALTLYRLSDNVGTGVVRIPEGPPEFPCASLTLATASSSSSSSSPSMDPSADYAFNPKTGESFAAPGDESGSGGGSVGATVLRCQIPTDVRVFAGLSATVVVTTASATAALVVPVGAVELTAGKTGKVTVVLEDGSHESREVEVGPNDGRFTVITSGLNEGDKVLDRLPDLEAEAKARFDGS